MPIISLHPVRERDHVPSALVAFVVSTAAPVAAAPCAGCRCAPMTCDSGCGHTCCCPDSYPLPAVALVDDGGALNDLGRDYAEEARQRAEARREAEAELVDEQRAQELRIVDTRGGDDWASFAERIQYALGERFGAALLQRTEIHVGLDDELLGDLAARADYSRTAVRP